MSAGHRLKQLREHLGLTIRDVELASEQIARKYGREDYSVPASRLSDVETKGVTPSIYRLYTLSVVYRRDIREIMAWYGIDLSETAADMTFSLPRNSHLTTLTQSQISVSVPVRIDPGFDPRRTTNIGRMIEKWGLVPLAFLQQYANHDYTYGYIGSEDFTMYPLLLPGSFVQVDESLDKVEEKMWRSEYERPIYFVETRDGYTCCWCSMKGDQLILQPHPLSNVPPKVMKDASEGEVIGQVVAVAMRLSGWQRVADDADRTPSGTGNGHANGPAKGNSTPKRLN